jgi:peptidoglycan hydrolase CwlO-like protein
MAIKTKKISDLGEIKIDDISGLNKTDFYFLGCMNGITGKVSTADVVQSIRETINSSVTKIAESTFGNMRSGDIDVSSLKTSIANVSSVTDENKKTINNLKSTINGFLKEVAELKSSLNDVTNKANRMEQFV